MKNHNGEWRKAPYRSRSGMIFGVCRGLADYLDFPVFWMRVIWLVVLCPAGVLPDRRQVSPIWPRLHCWERAALRAVFGLFDVGLWRLLGDYDGDFSQMVSLPKTPSMGDIGDELAVSEPSSLGWRRRIGQDPSESSRVDSTSQHPGTLSGEHGR